MSHGFNSTFQKFGCFVPVDFLSCMTLIIFSEKFWRQLMLWKGEMPLFLLCQGHPCPQIPNRRVNRRPCLYMRQAVGAIPRGFGGWEILVHWCYCAAESLPRAPAKLACRHLAAPSHQRVENIPSTNLPSRESRDQCRTHIWDQLDWKIAVPGECFQLPWNRQTIASCDWKNSELWDQCPKALRY